MAKIVVQVFFPLLCLLHFPGLIVAKYSSWASDFVFGSATEREALRPKIAESLGVHFCRREPEAPVLKDNLAAEFLGHPTRGWRGSSVNISKSYFGDDAIKAGNFRRKTDGPEMKFKGLQPGIYEFSVWAKLEAEAHNESHYFVAIRVPGQKVATGRIIGSGVAKTHCWSKLKGAFTIRDGSQKILTARIGGVTAGSALHLSAVYVSGQDQATYYEKQNALISQIRKRDVRLNVVDSKGKPFQGLVEIDQLQNSFGFGASSNAGILYNNSYQEWFKRRFTWTVFENEDKWYSEEYNRGFYYYPDSDKLTSFFKAKNISVRGHCVAWDDPYYVQDWLKALTKDGIVSAVTQRVRDVVTRYKGVAKHWDVLNEIWRHYFYENVTNDPYFAAVLHKLVKEVDPDALTFVNDYNILESYYYDPTAPERYLALINGIEAHGGPVDRIGVQGHFILADGPQVRNEIDVLATAGKPIWLTEFEIQNVDLGLQPDLFESIMREVFSHPIMEGVVMWGPVTLNDPTCTICMADYNLVDRPVGIRLLKLLKEWTTHRSQTLTNGIMKFRGFFGSYRARFYSGRSVVEKFFEVPTAKTDFNLTITLPI